MIYLLSKSVGKYEGLNHQDWDAITAFSTLDKAMVVAENQARDKKKAPVMLYWQMRNQGGLFYLEYPSRFVDGETSAYLIKKINVDEFVIKGVSE